jgi:hypothetical protein
MGFGKPFQREKYVGSRVISQLFWKHGDSPFWAGLMAAKRHFFSFASFSIKDVSEIRL